MCVCSGTLLQTCTAIAVGRTVSNQIIIYYPMTLRCILLFASLEVLQVYGSLTGCVHGGVKFKHGDHFLPTDPLLRAEIPGQCVQCRCQEGLVICEMENCPRVNCNTPIRMNQFCCPQCPEVANAQESPFSLTFPTRSSHSRSKNGCTSGSKYYAEGSTWQPVMGPLGLMACVQCSCRSHQINCQRFECHDPPCSRPRKQFGYCCPVCPAADENEKDSVKCLPRSSEVFVYKTPSISKSTGTIEFGFILDSARSKVELHSWNTKAEVTSALTVTILPKTDLDQYHILLVGATSYKNWIRFARREKRLQHRCSVQCADKVARLEQTLKLFPLRIRPQCYSDETVV